MEPDRALPRDSAVETDEVAALYARAGPSLVGLLTAIVGNVEGSLCIRAHEAAQQAVRLGPSPFTYRVRLTLDGKRYVGMAVWPRDERSDEAPNTVLSFDPPLPAY